MRRRALTLTLALAAPAATGKTVRPLHERTPAEILSNYTFVADFSLQPAEREVSEEIFWRYPLPVPKIEFEIEPAVVDARKEMPSTKGDGRAVDHLNRGRVLFLEGKPDEAKNTWLTARARFGKEFPYHRRNDYFVGSAFTAIAARDMKEKGLAYEDGQIRGTLANAATFLSWAFIVKVDHPDPLIDVVTPKGLYNLAAIYWRYGRFAGAFGAADSGLNFLRRTGRREYRQQFHRIVAESHIRNRSYLDAVQSLDLAIRQGDPSRDMPLAAASFARAGDIYFDLNNYDLAEDAYALGARVDEEMRQINPAQLVLRGESLFWLGRFDEAQRMLHFALQGGSYRRQVAPLPDGYAGWAALRIADSYLARKEIEKAKLEYYKVGHHYRGSLAGRIARVREACLELPFYRGNNVKHARELLEEAKTTQTAEDLPPPAQEIAWACQVGSYTDRERTPEMLDRVRAFASAHPESRFLRSFEEPVRGYQADRIEALFKAGDDYLVASFFEKNRKNLFPRVPPELAARLFVSYVDVSRSPSASEFWDAYRKEAPESDMKALRTAVVAAEMAARKGASATWSQRDQHTVVAYPKREWRLSPSDRAVGYVNRILNTPGADRHVPWLLNLARAWSAKDAQYECDLEYPLLSRLYERDAGKRTFVLARTSEVIQAQMPQLFKNDESCALSLLELEARGLRPRTRELAERYVARKDWPLVGGFLHLFWTISEHLNDDGDHASARRLWEVIRDKGPPASPEVRFARARLDPTRTEFEKLWD